MITSFTPVSALAGGALIGLAAVVLLRGSGRIAGISGVLNGLLEHGARDRAWRLAFLFGLLAGAGAWFALSDAWTPPRTDFSPAMLLLGGVLVGFGTRLGSGCTSGHGICGLARLSPRSMVAVLLFMGAGFATVALLRHGIG